MWERRLPGWCLLRMQSLIRWPSTRSVRTSALCVAAMLWTSCAPAGPPRTYRFTSNRDSAAALRCAADRLRIDDFLVVDDSTQAGPVVALRRMESTDEVGMPEWW